MSRRLVVLAALLSTALTPAAASPRLRFTISETANLAYQLDCLSGRIRCAKEAFHTLWRSLGWSGEDDQALHRWAELSDRYDASVTLRPRPPGPFPFDERRISWADKLRIAELSANDAAALERNLSLVTSAEDALALARIQARFAPRFHAWWSTHGARTLPAFRRGAQKLIREAKLEAFLDQVAAFYGAPQRESFDMHLIALPISKGISSGTQLENHGVIEVLEGEAPRERMDVILHEAFHTYFRQADGRRERVEQAFASSSDPDALAAWMLLDESLATALGNGLVAERVHSRSLAHRLARERGLYNDPYIDAMAKAILPLVRERLAKHAPLDAAFVSEYLTLAHRTLGEKLRDPGLLMKTLALAYDGDPLEPATERLDAGVRSRSVFSSSPLDAEESRAVPLEFPKLPLVVMLTHDRLAVLDDWRAILGEAALTDVKKRAAREAAFVQRIVRPAGAPAWIFVAEDPSGMEQLVDGFLAREKQ